MSEKGRYEVKIDSLKESRGLYDLLDVGGKFECLIWDQLFSLDEMFAAWKNETEKLGYTMSCALKLTVSDMHSSDKMIFVAGDSTLIQGKYDKGLYYMDAFYLMELHPYIKPPFRVLSNCLKPVLIFGISSRLTRSISAAFLTCLLSTASALLTAFIRASFP